MESQNQTSSKPASTTIQPKLVDIQIKDEFVALNVLVSFVNLAQRRGAFSIDESAKLFECIKMFQKAAELDD
jgi:hypothetical protein